MKRFQDEGSFSSFESFDDMSNANTMRPPASPANCCPFTLSLPESTPLDAVTAKMGLGKREGKTNAGDARHPYTTPNEEGVRGVVISYLCM